MGYDIIFRTEGNSNIGLGHIYRCLAIAESLNTDISFIFCLTEESDHSMVPQNYNKVILKDHSKEFEFLKKQKVEGSKLIIADGYAFNSLYQKQIKSLGFNLIYIDDLGKEIMYADAVINHSPGLDAHDFNLINSSLYLGPKYSIIRKEFLDYTPVALDRKKILVSFGGSDPKNLTKKFIPYLCEELQDFQIQVVTGSSYKDQYWLQKFSSEKKNLNIHNAITAIELREIIQKSYLAILPCSTMLYEACSLRSNVLSGYFVDNQYKIYKGFVNNELIIDLGNLSVLTPSELLSKIKRTLCDKEMTNKIRINQEKLFDGRSMQRINQIIAEFL